MSRYRKISPTIWNDGKFSTLSDDAQLIFLYLLTHPHQTSLGAMRASVPGLAAEKRWKLPRFERAFGDIEALDMLRHDPEASLVWLPKFLKHNPPENPNVVKSWMASLELLPECQMKLELINCVKEFVEGLQEGFREALPEPFRKGMPIQEQEQEQEHKEEPASPTPASSGGKSKKKTSHNIPPELQPIADRIIGTINQLAGTAFKAESQLVVRGLVPRLQAGATENDCLAVVESKWREWGKKPGHAAILQSRNTLP